MDLVARELAERDPWRKLHQAGDTLPELEFRL